MTAQPSPVSIQELLDERSWLHGLSAALVGATDAEDLTQDALLIAWQRSTRPGAGNAPFQSPRGWLAGIAYRLAMARGRQTKSRQAHLRMYGVDGLVEGQHDPQPGVDELAERAELERGVVELLLELDELYRGVLLLRFQGGLSAAEIARRLRRPPGTVRRQLKTGLDELRRRMEDRHGERAGWAPALLGWPALEWGGRVATTVSAPALAASSILVLIMKSVPVVLLCALAVSGWVLRSQWLPADDGALIQVSSVQVGSAAVDQAFGDAPSVRAPDAAADGHLAGIRRTRVDTGVKTPVPTAAAPDAVAYRITDAAGEPVDIGRAVLVVGDQALDMELKGDGVVELGTDVEARDMALDVAQGHLAVARTNSWPHVFDVSITRAVAALDWPAGRTVEGRLSAGAQAPGEPIELTLFRDAGWSGSQVLADLTEGDSKLLRRVNVGADGHFVLRDFPDGWRGYLQIERAWRFAPSGAARRMVDLDGASGLQFEVAPAPRVVAKLVALDGVTSTSGVAVAIVEMSSKSKTYYGSTSDQGGHVEWRPRAGVDEIELQVGTGERFLMAKTDRRRMPPIGVLDFGEVRLETGSDLYVRVVDADGGAVELAVVSEIRPGAQHGASIDDRGMARLRVRGGMAVPLRVRAPGFAHARFDVPAGQGTAPFVAVLERAFRLHLTVVDVHGAPCPETAVVLVLSEGTTPDVRREFEAATGAAPAFVSIRERVNGGTSYEVFSDAEGRVDLEGIPASLQIQCGFHDDDWEWLAPPIVIEAGPNGAWVGDLVDSRPNSMRVLVRVASKQGLPIEGATVELNGRVDSRTDADGQFQIEVPADGARAVVEVSATGFASRFLDLREREAAGGPKEIQLARIEPRQFRVVDGRGAALAGVQVRLAAETGDTWMRTMGEATTSSYGECSVSCVASGLLRIQVTAEDITYQTWTSSTEEVVRVLVKEPGELAVRWSGLGDKVEKAALRRSDADGGFSGDRRNPATVAKVWDLTPEERAEGEVILRWAPGRYELLLGSEAGLAERMIVEVVTGKRTEVVVMP